MLKYIVQPGDSLDNIAFRFKTSINSIMRTNMIYDIHHIYPGQLIYIPIPINKYINANERINDYILDKPVIKEKAELNAPPFCAKMILSGIFTLLSTSKRVYRAGDTIVLNLFKLNLSPNPVSLHYSSGQRYDFKIIYPTGQTLWMWSINKSFIQALGTVTLNVRQSILYNESFTLPVNTPPGLYRVLGWNTSYETRNYKLHLPIYITNHI